MMDVWLLKVASYGGMLSFQLQYTLLSDDAHSYFDADVELIVSITNHHVHSSNTNSDKNCLLIMILTLMVVIKMMLLL